MENHYPLINRIAALNGESWAAPASTVAAYWSALGAGADELVLTVFITKDQQLVCAPVDAIPLIGSSTKIRDLTLEQVQNYDAGSEFRSTQLNDDWQPTGVRGEDTPWIAKPRDGALKARVALQYQSLRDVLALFARRVSIAIVTPENADNDYWACLLNQINSYGLQRKLRLLANQSNSEMIREHDQAIAIAVDVRGQTVDLDLFDFLEKINSSNLLANVEQLQQLSDQQRNVIFEKANRLGVQWMLSSATMPFAPSSAVLFELQSYECHIDSYLTPAPLATAWACAPRATVFSENFGGTKLDQRYWNAGYSHINQETEIRVEDGLIIDIASGKKYSGAAAICTLPVHGDFDAIVSFRVRNPYQATTFEMAAIGIDPGYPQMDNKKLDTRSVNLTFDVHGAPPYASSERDQNDGFRCGWNNSFNLTQFGDDSVNSTDAKWYASSVNMYNKYGRDVGNGSSDSLTGCLRLIRHGAVFNSYYRDRFNPEWVCSGTMLVSAMPTNCFIRLAAKHWDKLKPEPAPDNTIKFWGFQLRQY